MASNQAAAPMQSGGGEAPPGFKVPPGSPPPYPPGAPPQIPGQQPIPIPMIAQTSLGYNSMVVTCGGCGQPISTRVYKSPSLIAWVSCGAICILGGFLCCCLIPFCIPSCYDVEHSCPNCGVHLGRTRALSN